MIFRSLRIVFPMLALGAVVGLAACGSGGGSSEAGLTVSFFAQPAEPPASQASAARTFVNTEGTEITLDRAWLVLWSEALATECTGSDFAWDTRHWLDWILPPARAHADESPTVQSTPHVVALLGDASDPMRLGAALPPPGTYCGVEVALRAADADTVDLPADVDMVGRTLYVAGRYLDQHGAAVPFVIETGRTLRPARRLFPVPLTLDRDHSSARVVLEIRYHRWFDGLDLTRLDDPAQEDQLLHNVTASLVVRSVEP